MENVNPALSLVMALKFGLERGDSVRHSVQKYLQSEHHPFKSTVGQWLVLRDTDQDPEGLFRTIKSPYRQAILRVLDRGLLGESIYPTLVALENEINDAVRSELDGFLSVLPIKMLIPLLLFQFPAFLILLFGPLLNELLQSF